MRSEAGKKEAEAFRCRWRVAHESKYAAASQEAKTHERKLESSLQASDRDTCLQAGRGSDLVKRPGCVLGPTKAVTFLFFAFCAWRRAKPDTSKPKPRQSNKQKLITNTTQNCLNPSFFSPCRAVPAFVHQKFRCFVSSSPYLHTPPPLPLLPIPSYHLFQPLQGQ
jgi:hypothetical protein